MISSLKAMLFTSAATSLPLEGQETAALPEGAPDFAQLLSGTMEASAVVAPASMPILDAPAVPEAIPVAVDAMPVGAEAAVSDEQAVPMEQAAPAPILPLALATALQAAQGQQGDALVEALPLPRGSADMVEAEAPVERGQPLPTPVPETETVEIVAEDAAPVEEMVQAQQPPIKPAGPSKTHQATVQAETSEALPTPSEPKADAPQGEAIADPVEHPDAPTTVAQTPAVAAMALPTPQPLFATTPAPIAVSQAEAPPTKAVEIKAAPAPQPTKAQGDAVKGKARPVENIRPVEAQAEVGAVTEPAPVMAAAPVAQVAPTPLPDPVQPTSGQPVLQERVAQADKMPPAVAAPSIVATEPMAAQPAPVEPASIKQDQVAVTDSSIATDPALPQAAATPRPQLAKPEALALLQMVRDQMQVRQPAPQARVSEQVTAAPRAKVERAAVSADAAPISQPQLQPMPSDASPPLAQVASTPIMAQPTITAQPVADLSASLGAQVVDMGVSGQWIDNLARDIAGLSANGAQGRFQINTDRLGAVQVDIRQGDNGAAINLTVASEAAEMALRQDSDRLKLDAGLSAIRIAEVKIERAPHVAEAARTDGANQQNQQQSSQQQGQQQPGQSAWANNQNMGQSAQQQGRWRGAENSGFASKNSGDPAVLNHDDMRRNGNDSVRARYA